MTFFFAHLAGAGLIPVGMGIMGDAGHFASAIILVGVLILISVALFRYLKYKEDESS